MNEWTKERDFRQSERKREREKRDRERELKRVETVWEVEMRDKFRWEQNKTFEKWLKKLFGEWKWNTYQNGENGGGKKVEHIFK